MSYVKLVLHLFKHDILKSQDDEPPLTRTIKEGILNYLNDKYDNDTTEKLHGYTPRPTVKTVYIKEERINILKTRAAAEMEHLVAGGDPAAPAVSIPPPSAVPAAAADESELPAPKKAKKFLSSYFKKIAAPTGQGTTKPSRASIELELNMYLQTADLDAEKDPLVWWRQHEVNFPLVAKLAKKYLCIPHIHVHTYIISLTNTQKSSKILYRDISLSGLKIQACDFFNMKM